MPALFALSASVGVTAGIAVLVRPVRPVLGAVAVAHLLMLATWVASRTTGVSFVDGLEQVEPVGFPDAVAAAFEAVVVLGALVLCRRPRPGRLPHAAARAAAVPVALAVALLGGPAVYVGATSEHDHAGGSAAPAHVHDEGAVHDHADGGTAAGASGVEPSHHHSSAAAVPFDPAAPIDLSGTPGVTPVQQAQAELLLARTLQALPAFADQAAAEAAGYHSIRDAMTGDEHLINWDAIDDQYILDPEHPESLVYDVRSGTPILEAAMFILPDGYTLDDVPDIGGPLIQWHVHDDLCFTDGTPPVLAGLRSLGGPCQPGAVAFPPHPMIHVWVRKNPCGPFAALEGVGAGQTKSGVRDCDHAHGSTGTF
jgi:hypothetical protein